MKLHHRVCFPMTFDWPSFANDYCNKDCNHVFSCTCFFSDFPSLVPIKPTSRYVKAWPAKASSCFQVFSKAMTGNSSKWTPKWNIPSSELTYPLLKALLKIIFLFQRWDIWICYDMLVPRIIKANMISPFLKMHWSILFVWCPPKRSSQALSKDSKSSPIHGCGNNLEEFWCIKIYLHIDRLLVVYQTISHIESDYNL